VLVVLGASSLLNAAYFLPILRVAWFAPQSGAWPHEHQSTGRFETYWMLLLPPLITAVLALAAGIFAQAPFSPLAWARLLAAREYLE